MDPLKILFSAYLVFYLLGVAFSVGQVGKPREPMSAGAAGCGVLFASIVFVMFLVIWTRI